MSSEINSIRQEIIRKTVEYYKAKQTAETKFTPGKTPINYAGRVYDAAELCNAVEASLDFWLTESRFSTIFASKIQDFLDVKHALLCNSGSSANLLALTALTSTKLDDKRLKAGDEVISVAAGFPTSVSPILQNGLVPVFVDVDMATYNINIETMQRAISAKTRCIFLAHTLGNPFNIDAVMQLAAQYKLWVIEDNCDAFGSVYKGRKTGTFGHLSTFSFYPAHHITSGEGGAVCTNDSLLAKVVRSFRDWGRDCYCTGGQNNSCGKRFSQQFGNLPFGFDHKYVYSEIGYNLKMTELQAAIGAAQMDKLSWFCKQRIENFKKWETIFSKYDDFFILPKETDGAQPAWFAYIVTLKNGTPFNRNEFTGFLNRKGIETRNLFAGNITKQPAFMNKKWRIADHLNNTNLIMSNSFFLGTYPGLSDEMFAYAEEVIHEFLGFQHKKSGFRSELKGIY